jgi:hypothetical protein
MMIKCVKWCMVFIFITNGCFAMDNEDKDNPPYIEHVVAIFRDAAKQIERELGLECIGSGGAMPRDVERIDLDFIAYQRATVEQARELEVKATEKLVKIINAHEKIRPFLREFPSPASRTGVSISFCKKKQRFLYGWQCCLLFADKGQDLLSCRRP